jgi:predicted lipoprotein with Yx(FWY)xxD motif
MSKQRSLIGLAALIGLIATQACSSSDDSSNNGSTSGAGQTSSAGASSSVAGASSSQAGTGGSGTSGATGSAGASGSTSSAGSGGSSAGSGGAATGGSAGASGGSGGSGGAGGAQTDAFSTHTSTVGNVLVTNVGRTLYFYQPDTPAAGATAALSACTGTCLTHWPLYYGNPVTVAAGLSASDFGSFDRGGGVMQSTFHGWPVYMYDDDKVAGDAKGDMEKNTMGKVVWYAVKIPFTTAPPKP